MTPADIVGTWVHQSAVPMGGGVMRISSTWTFTADGRATFATTSGLEHDGRTVNQNATDHAGTWAVADGGDKLVVELAGHSDSPFRLTLTAPGELTARRRGVWRRQPAGG